MKRFVAIFILGLFVLGTISGCGGGNSGSNIRTATVTTIAGGGDDGQTSGSKDGTGKAALFNSPLGVASDANGNIYVADCMNNSIREINPATLVVTTINTAALFNNPRGIAVDLSGNIYVADSNNNKIVKITGGSFIVTTIAGDGTPSSNDGPGVTASFNSPNDVTVDGNGNIYVADYYNNKIRKITPGSGGTFEVTTITTLFNQPNGVAVDLSGNIYVADSGNHKIRRINPITFEVTTIAGGGSDGKTSGNIDGIGINALFNLPDGVAVDSSGNIYVADCLNNKIRKINPTTFEVTTVAGGGLSGQTPGSTDGTGVAVLFNAPANLVVDSSGNIYVADSGNHKIRKITMN